MHTYHSGKATEAVAGLTCACCKAERRRNGAMQEAAHRMRTRCMMTLMKPRVASLSCMGARRRLRHSAGRCPSLASSVQSTWSELSNRAACRSSGCTRAKPYLRHHLFYLPPRPGSMHRGHATPGMVAEAHGAACPSTALRWAGFLLVPDATGSQHRQTGCMYGFLVSHNAHSPMPGAVCKRPPGAESWNASL